MQTVNEKDFDELVACGNDYFMQENNPQSAIECYKKALEINPDDIRTKVCLGVSYLKLKNFEKGWELFENRYPANDLIKPIWKGENIEDKTLYVYYEAGFGDTIMFARFLPLLKNKCKKVLFHPQTELAKFFQDSDLGVEILCKNSKTIDMDFDYHIPMRSLPYALKITSEADIPSKDNYLKVDENKVRFYKENYCDNDKFKIGINWRGNSVSDDRRQIDLRFFEGLDLPNTQIYSLQVGVSGKLPKNFVDLGSTFNDFSDTAAAIENLDLIISNDTSLVHVAGALGKKCFVLLPFAPDWRWGVSLDSSYWYYSLKLFTQKHPENWQEVFEEIHAEIQR